MTYFITAIVYFGLWMTIMVAREEFNILTISYVCIFLYTAIWATYHLWGATL